jgi:hypothetical protein
MLFKRQLYEKALADFDYVGHADDEVLSRRMLLLAGRISGNEGVYYYRYVPKAPSPERVLGQVRANLTALEMGSRVFSRTGDRRALCDMRNVISRDFAGLTVRAARGEIPWHEVSELLARYRAIDVPWRFGDAKFRAMDLYVKGALRFRRGLPERRE